MNILFICPNFFDYHNFLIKAIEKQNHYVHFIEDNLNIEHEISKLSNRRFDLILIISGFNISEKNILSLKQHSKKAKVVVYQWDSFLNNPNGINLINYSDTYYSFDFEDCKMYNLEYKPLFFIDHKSTQVDSDIDVLFVGKLHGKRLKLLKKLLKKNRNTVIKILVSPLRYYYVILTNIFSFRKMKSWLITAKVDYNNYLNLLSRSNVIVDIHHLKQSGLTMRSIEALSAKKKLLTTNANILKDPIFKDAPVMIFDNQLSQKKLSEFIKKPIDEEFNIDFLNIDIWIKNLLEK